MLFCNCQESFVFINRDEVIIFLIGCCCFRVLLFIVETKYYTNQDGIRIIYLDEPQIIKNRKYIVSLFFRDGKIYMLSLICCDEEYSEKDESKRKDLHDLILKELGVLENSNFEWGEIKSIYDARSNISSINIIYYAST